MAKTKIKQKPLDPESLHDVDLFEIRRGHWRQPLIEPDFPGVFTGPKPQVVTLCGSTRFVEEFNRWRQILTLKGCIVLSIELVTTQMREEDPQHVNRANKEMLDLLHFEKIKLSDSVLVLNVDGYIGDSTRKEIDFAASVNVEIFYLEALV